MCYEVTAKQHLGVLQVQALGGLGLALGAILAKSNHSVFNCNGNKALLCLLHSQWKGIMFPAHTVITRDLFRYSNTLSRRIFSLSLSFSLEVSDSPREHSSVADIALVSYPHDISSQFQQNSYVF